MNYKKYELRELIKIKNGKDYRNEKKGLIPVYGTGGIVDYIDKHIYNGESILLPRKGSLNNIEYIDGKFWTIDTMYWTKINKNIVYGKFLFLYLSLLNITKRNTGSTLPSMTFETYYSLKIPLPEYEKQKKIADFIFMILDKIKNNSQINNNLEELMKTIYQRWFIEFEFPNEEGKPYKSSGDKFVYNDELKQEIPEGWNVKKITEIANVYQPEIITIKDIDLNGDYLLYGAGGLMGKYNKFNHEKSAIAISCRGNCGDTFMTQPKSWINGNVMVVAPIEKYNYKEYIFRSLFKEKIMPLITGSVQKQITRTNLSNLKLLIPNKRTLELFEDTVKPYRSKINLVINENQRLTDLKNFLLPLLMNGQINVDDIEI